MNLFFHSILIIIFLVKCFEHDQIPNKFANELLKFRLRLTKNISNLLWNYSIVSTNLHSPGRNKRSRISSGNCMHFTLALNDSKHKFCVFVKRILEDDIIDKNMTIYVQSPSSLDKKMYKLKDLLIMKAQGYDTTNPFSSFLDGFIENNSFYGRMYIRGSLYYLEPVVKFPNILRKIKSTATVKNRSLSSLAVLYKHSDFGNQMGNGEEDVLVDIEHLISSYSERSKNYQYYHGQYLKSKGRLCSVLLHADNVFLQDIAQGDIKSAVSQMLHVLDQVNVIFRNADFDDDGVPDNIGFQVKHIVIMTSDAAANFPEKGAVDGYQYLQYLSTYFLLEQVCIGIGFTGRPFKSKILGLSYTAAVMQKAGPVVGGICEPTIGGLHFNVLALTVTSEAGHRIPTAVVVLSLAHELGHSFGSPHDDQKSDQCGGYIMTDYSVNGSSRIQYMFSPCSKRKIAHVIQNKGFCLQDSTDSFCGNGLLERDEDCDCGLAIDCLRRDYCCTPRGAPRGGCRVNRGEGYTCHPSQGLCCMSHCQIRDLHHLGLNCSLQMNTCPCPVEDPSECDCGLLGSCIVDTCHSIECTRLGLEECRCMNSSDHCVSCCKDPRDGSCIPSLTLTSRLLHEGKLIFSTLRHRANISPAYVRGDMSIIRRFCYQGQCVQLGFRVWQSEGFCIAFGRLGICSTGVCDIKHIWKPQSIQISSCVFVVPVMFVFVLCFVVHFTSHLLQA